MASALSYPGVYIEELSSGVRTITGVATSITAFIGRAQRGSTDLPIRIQSFSEFERTFGGLWRESRMTYAVSHFFQHGGSDALIVRVAKEGKAATWAADKFKLVAASPGKWGNNLRVRVDYGGTPEITGLKFNITIRDTASGVTERFLNVSVDKNDKLFITSVLAEQSTLVRVDGDPPTTRPAKSPAPATASEDPMSEGSSGSKPFNTDGDDGKPITDKEISDPALEADRKGIWMLEHADLFNLLCIPPLSPDTDVNTSWPIAAKYCRDRRAILIIDPSASWTASQPATVAAATAGVNTLRSAIGNELARNSVVYFPRLRMPDSLNDNRLGEFAPCGAIAGIIARTDAQRGVWKAPAGLDASFSGVPEFTYKLTDGENGQLNPLGLNCFRSFPVNGNVVWGARTLVGADQLASEWKYLPVRRTALFIEESLFRGTQWVVFEPNDEPLWAQIRLNIGAFMHNLFRQGAFQGRSPREAYLVKCDKETTTQNDINLGIVNILVGFAPLKPAEFVVIKIQQLAGQIDV
jgi:phage tail sheath protein FI